jgi:hypothetical protein
VLAKPRKFYKTLGAGVFAIGVGIAAGLASDFADSSWNITKKREMRETLETVITAFKEDVEEYNSFLVTMLYNFFSHLTMQQNELCVYIWHVLYG